MSSIREKVINDLRPKPFTKLAKMWIGLLLTVCAIGVYAYIRQLQDGLVITGLRDYTTWGIYIANFVFFVAVSLVGSLITAVLKLSGVSWRTPLTRISEIIALAAILMAGLAIVVDMGRPDRMLNVIFHARMQSPITWDVMVITTYMALSFLLLFLPLIPDIAIYRKDDKLPKWLLKIYNFFSLNWTGSSAQKSLLKQSVYILAVMIIPVAIGMRTVSSLLFTTTTKPGWDSTNLGPYFVAGAFVVGLGTFIIVMSACRKFLHQGEYFTDKHFDYVSKLMVFLLLVYLFFNINEYFSPAYKMKSNEADHLNELFFGSNALMFWLVQIGGLVIPLIVLMFKKGRKPYVAFAVSVLIVIGAWFKWYLIIVPALSHPAIPIDRAPYEWVNYIPTWQEWAITAATLAGMLLIVTYLLRLFPIVPVAEYIDEQEKKMRKS
ncbi:MAG: polysulfide reductase [Bacteroidetes bacterium]|nr:MAG: polysulfide reductase [Bacteroidota bacterium]